MAFVKAQRKAAKIKLALTGPSGSGKTYSALRLAFGLGQRVALIDTENGSGSLYADVNRDGIGEYDVLEISAPFTVRKYTDAIAEAVRGGYDVLVVDSITHAWAGSGGLLEQKEALDSRGGTQNRFSNWGTITKQHEEFKAALLEAPIHLIATMRSKVEYQQDDNRKVHKLGMAPIQRDGMDYEFTLVFDVDQTHSAVASKDRTGLFEGQTGKLTQQHGERIAQWLAGGAPVAPQPRPSQANPGPQAARQHVQGGERHPSVPIANGGPGQAPAQPSMGALEPKEERKSIWTAGGGHGDTGAQRPESRGDLGAADTALLACSKADCGKPLTRGQHDVSVRAFGAPMCPSCQRVQARGAA